MTVNTSSSIENRLIKFIDVVFYKAMYKDIEATGVDPLGHYVKFGYRENRRPNRWYTDKLVPKKLILANPSTPTFLLFLKYLPGISESKFDELCESAESVDYGHEECWECDVMRSAFDGNYYRNKYPDVQNNMDALTHFCEIGWKEKRKPSSTFDIDYYLKSNPDVAFANINPFVHYINEGCFEGRKPQSLDNVKQKLLDTLKTMMEISQEYLNISPKLQFIPEEKLLITLLKSTDLCISISHDDYMSHTGGVQKFIRDECRYTNEAGYDYLHFCPTIPGIRIDKENGISTFLINCSLNNIFIGTFTAIEITNVLTSLIIKKPNILQVAVIHSLMGWSIEVVLSIMKASFAYQFFYVHDYFSLCSEYRLLRNNLVPCDAPLLDSINCNICAHGDTRTGHLTDFKIFFDELKPTLIYPSNCSKKIFEAGYAAKMKSVVIPHIQVSQKPVSKNNQVRLKDKIRIAFCGSPVAHKGFYHFEEIVDKSLSNICLEFFHFGSVDAKLQNVEFIKTVLKNGKSPMVKKIKEYEIDIVFIGSTWRETFNFVAYEALQAGAAIIALTSSGNVCDVIKSYKVGQTVNSWQECLELLNDTHLTEKLDMWQTAINELSFAENKSFLTKGVLPK